MTTFWKLIFPSPFLAISTTNIPKKRQSKHNFTTLNWTLKIVNLWTAMIANKSYLFGTILHVFLHLEISVGRWSFIRLLRLSDEPSGQDQQHKQGNNVAERKSRPAAREIVVWCRFGLSEKFLTGAGGPFNKLGRGRHRGGKRGF